MKEKKRIKQLSQREGVNVDSFFTFAGGVVTTFLGFVGSNLYGSFRRQTSLAAALVAEIDAVKSRYLEATQGNGIRVAWDGQRYWTMNVQSNYFTVFECNTDKLGEFSPAEATTIVAFYVTAKGYVDSLRAFQNRVHRLPGTGPQEHLALQGMLELLIRDETLVFQKMDEARRILQQYACRTVLDFPRAVWNTVRNKGISAG